MRAGCDKVRGAIAGEAAHGGRADGRTVGIGPCVIVMTLLSLLYRFISNFVLLMLAYYSLNALENYQQRSILALLILIYVLTRAISAWRSFSFFQSIERLENESRRIGSLLGLRADQSLIKRQIINDVTEKRRHGELKAYIDLLFMTLVVVLSVTKIVSE